MPQFSCDEGRTTKNKKGNAYYLSNDGNDTNDGSRNNPWKTIGKLNSAQLRAGDTIFFRGSHVFEGTVVVDSFDRGTNDNPVVLTSYGNTSAVIRSGTTRALVVSQTEYIKIQDLHMEGSGRKDGNIENGVVLSNSHHLYIDSLDIKGFQKSGLLVYRSSDVDVNRVYAHDNGAAGISVSGSTSKEDCKNILIHHCRAENNPGDPTNLTNHSGNGIVVGFCRGVTIEHCVATNNGWDMPRTGNGPVGIWAYEADSVIIQYCIAYRNKTSQGGEDGGGFDLDGGVTNSMVQYCLSYENHGSGFGIFQYAGASPWKNNTIRFNISENDGLVSTAHAGIYIWNGSGDENQFTDCFIYNNVISNGQGAAIHFSAESSRKRFSYHNNIFIASDELTKGLSVNDTFLGNNWWSLKSDFNIHGMKNFEAWILQTGQEKKDGAVTGMNIHPGFENDQVTMITDPSGLGSFLKYKLPDSSPLRMKGLDLKAVFGIEAGDKDFNQNPAPAKGIGASF